MKFPVILLLVALAGSVASAAPKVRWPRDVVEWEKLKEAEKVIAENGVTKHVQRKLMEEWSATRWVWLGHRLLQNWYAWHKQTVVEEHMMLNWYR